MTTIISLSHDTNVLPNAITNWEDLNDQTQDFMLSGTHFRVMSPQELIIYNGRQAIASCMIFLHENNNITIENCWTKEGQLF